MPAAAEPPTLDALVAALVEAAPALDADDRRIALATYRLLTDGAPARPQAVAAAAGLAEATVEGRLGTWPGVYRDGSGAVVGFWGLALQRLEPEYRLRSDGADVGYAWCAWDTLFLPALLGRTLVITAADGSTGAPVTLTVGPDGVRSVEPAGTVVSFLVPDGPFDADIIAGFCHKVLFFRDAGGAARWMAGRPEELFTVPVAAAFEVGRRWNVARFGDTLPG